MWAPEDAHSWWKGRTGAHAFSPSHMPPHRSVPSELKLQLPFLPPFTSAFLPICSRGHWIEYPRNCRHRPAAEGVANKASSSREPLPHSSQPPSLVHPGSSPHWTAYRPLETGNADIMRMPHKAPWQYLLWSSKRQNCQQAVIVSHEGESHSWLCYLLVVWPWTSPLTWLHCKKTVMVDLLCPHTSLKHLLQETLMCNIDKHCLASVRQYRGASNLVLGRQMEEQISVTPFGSYTVVELEHSRERD